MTYINKVFLLLFLLLAFSVTGVRASGPSLTLSPDVVSPVINQNFTVKIILDTGGLEVGGAGVKLAFDPRFFQAVKIQPGVIFADYPSEIIDNTNGRVTISGIVSSPSTLYKGVSEFANVEFRPTASGTSKISILFTPGSTTDSNIAVLSGKGDVLESVNQMSVVTKSQENTGSKALSLASPSPTKSTYVSFLSDLFNKIILFFNPGAKDKLSSQRDGRFQIENVNATGPIVRQPPITDPISNQPLAAAPRITGATTGGVNLISIIGFSAAGVLILTLIFMFIRSKQTNN